jgi:hypothetical protein
MAGAKIALTSTSGEFQQDAFGNAKVNLPTSSAQAGCAQFFSQNDDGTITGTPYVRSPETSVDYRLRVGIDTVLFSDSFNATAQNTNNWNYTFVTMTAAQAGAGTVNFGTVQGTTNTHGAFMRSAQYFPVIGTAPLSVEITAGQFTAALAANEVWLMGLGLPTAAVTEPTDGCWLRLTTAGLIGEVRYNGTTLQTAVLRTLGQLTTSELFKFAIVVGEMEVEYWLDDVLLAEQIIPPSNGQPFLQASLPVFLHKYCNGVVANTNQMRVSDVTVSLLDLQTAKPWAHQLAGAGQNSANGQNGGTMGTTALLPNATAATTVTGAAISQTVPIAVGLGGQAGIVAAVPGVDGLITSYQVPAPTINITGRNLYITGVRIDAVNIGAAVATTASVLQWSLAYGATGATVPTLAQAETGSFVTATARAWRRVPLGLQSWIVGAAIGVSAEAITVQFDTPIVVRPGEWVASVAKFLVGTATASQVIWTVTMINGYYE